MNSRRLIALIPVLALAGCGYYSFSGATIPSHLSTIAVPLATDNSVSTQTGLDERLTRLLVDRFVGQTRLSLTTDAIGADVVLESSLDSYTNLPTSVSGDERATRNRITISVRVRYRDQVENLDMIERSFSGFEEYDPLDPASEEQAADAALEKIADDIFTAATSNW